MPMPLSSVRVREPHAGGTGTGELNTQPPTPGSICAPQDQPLPCTGEDPSQGGDKPKSPNIPKATRPITGGEPKPGPQISPLLPCALDRAEPSQGPCAKMPPGSPGKSWVVTASARLSSGGRPSLRLKSGTCRQRRWGGGEWAPGATCRPTCSRGTAHLLRGLLAAAEVADDAIAEGPEEPGVFGVMWDPLQLQQLILLLQPAVERRLLPVHPAGTAGGVSPLLGTRDSWPPTPRPRVLLRPEWGSWQPLEGSSRRHRGHCSPRENRGAWAPGPAAHSYTRRSCTKHQGPAPSNPSRSPSPTTCRAAAA